MKTFFQLIYFNSKTEISVYFTSTQLPAFHIVMFLCHEPLNNGESFHLKFRLPKSLNRGRCARRT